MPVVFDEVEARVDRAPQPQPQQPPAPAPARLKPAEIRRELRRIEQRKARLKAD